MHILVSAPAIMDWIGFSQKPIIERFKIVLALLKLTKMRKIIIFFGRIALLVMIWVSTIK